MKGLLCLKFHRRHLVDCKNNLEVKVTGNKMVCLSDTENNCRKVIDICILPLADASTTTTTAATTTTSKTTTTVTTTYTTSTTISTTTKAATTTTSTTTTTTVTATLYNKETNSFTVSNTNINLTQILFQTVKEGLSDVIEEVTEPSTNLGESNLSTSFTVTLTPKSEESSENLFSLKMGIVVVTKPSTHLEESTEKPEENSTTASAQDSGVEPSTNFTVTLTPRSEEENSANLYSLQMGFSFFIPILLILALCGIVSFLIYKRNTHVKASVRSDEIEMRSARFRAQLTQDSPYFEDPRYRLPSYSNTFKQRRGLPQIPQSPQQGESDSAYGFVSQNVYALNPEDIYTEAE